MERQCLPPISRKVETLLVAMRLSDEQRQVTDMRLSVSKKVRELSQGQRVAQLKTKNHERRLLAEKHRMERDADAQHVWEGLARASSGTPSQPPLPHRNVVLPPIGAEPQSNRHREPLYPSTSASILALLRGPNNGHTSAHVSFPPISGVAGEGGKEHRRQRPVLSNNETIDVSML